METDDKVLSTVERSPTHELRVAWSNYKGRQFVNVRAWWRETEEDEWKPGKGVTIRLTEVAAVAHCLSHVADWLEKQWAELPAQE
jgi:hypothetical protein